MVNPAAVYRRMAVETSSPGQLIVMLYRGAIRSTRQAIDAIEERRLETANNEFLRAEAIVRELRDSLRADAGPIAESLDALYGYFERQLIQANMRKDPAPAAEVAGMLESLLQAWEGAMKGDVSAPSVLRAGGPHAGAYG